MDSSEEGGARTARGLNQGVSVTAIGTLFFVRVCDYLIGSF